MHGQEFEFRRQLGKIGKPVDRGEFYELVQGVEGYHDNPINMIVFTAGILQPPFFDPRMDDAARTDEHSPGRWRVNGVVSNMPAFANAYGCKRGDAMVRREPCRIW